MLKPFVELREIDVTPYCDFREGKDDKGNKVQIPYLPWAKCLNLLYDNGAERVRFRALTAPDGSYLFKGEEHTSTSRNGETRTGACYFVTVSVEIDGETTIMPYPVMNGTAVVYNDTLNQLRVSNAIQRAFVKCVAVNTGLGIKLWEKDNETADVGGKQPEEVFPGTPRLVKETIERLVTAKATKTGASRDEIMSSLGITLKNYLDVLRHLDNASWLLGVLSK